MFEKKPLRKFVFRTNVIVPSLLSSPQGGFIIYHSTLAGSLKSVRDRVTELIFRARLTPEVEQKSVYSEKSAQHAEAGGQAYAAASQGTAQQQEDMAAAEQAGGRGDDDAMLTRKQRRARAAHGKDEDSSPNAGGRFRNRKRKKR